MQQAEPNQEKIEKTEKYPRDFAVKLIVKLLLSKNILIDEKTISQVNEKVSAVELNDVVDINVFAASIVNEILYPRKDKSFDADDEEQTHFCGIPTSVEVLYPYNKKPKKADVSCFVQYFKKRYDGIKQILAARPDLNAITSISRIKSKVDKEQVSLVGMISEKAETKNGNIILTVEDPTGEIKVLLGKDKKDVKEIAIDLVLDDIIGIKGQSTGEIVFANSIFLPEVPQTKEYKKCSDEIYACFLSDIHAGSKQFLKENFEKFLRWIRGEAGDEAQKEIAARIKYIFIAGDLVDGVGIYPGQEKDLDVKDIFEQYKLCFNYLDKIPKDKIIILSQGNHDAGRLSEPQPPLHEKFRQGADFSNFVFVNNPGTVRIHKSKNFEGFTCLLYHGYSFDYYVANVNSIRNNGGYDRADLIMKFLLQRRHLAPSYTSTLYNVDELEDPLIIKELPDFFITGHIHKTAVSNYKNITMVSGSTWQDKTEFQEKLGHKPEPCRVPIVNLNTRDIKIIRF
jgi:DNA polymerase II small subunit